MPVDQGALVEVANQLRAAVAERIETTAATMLRDYLIANPDETPGQVLTALFPDPTLLVVPDDVISAMARGVRTENIAVGVQRRLTWIGPLP